MPAHNPPLSFFVSSLSECWEAYNASKPAKETCSHCGDALAVVEGKFSGSFVKLGDGIKVHGGFIKQSEIPRALGAGSMRDFHALTAVFAKLRSTVVASCWGVSDSASVDIFSRKWLTKRSSPLLLKHSPF